MSELISGSTSRQLSQAAFERAQRLMPGGVNSPARAFGAVGGTPVFIDHAEGATLFDVDGNQYLDYIASWGPMILGHRHPAVVEALEKAIARGTSYGAPTEAENELAERIIDAVNSIEKVRLVNSGTEATMSAIRLARAFTGRDLLIKFAGNYHGHVDSLLVAAGSSAATLGVPSSPGVTVGTSQDTLVLEYNDVEGLRNAFAEHSQKIAAVVFEPVVGNMGVVRPSQEFCQSLETLTKASGALLICDEVMTGFRVAYGGAQHLLGIQPDLTTLGKIVGGGLPVGAYGGRVEIMDRVLPAGDVFQAGTLSGNPLATAAGCATLRILKDEPPYELLERLSARLAAGLQNAAERAGVAHTVARVGSMLTLFFYSESIVDWRSASKCDTKRFAKFFWGMMDRGIYLPCSQYEAMFVSAAHSEEDVDRTIAAAVEVMGEL
ncbi:MAG: glutamate-1-semialdehyde 2,1-aminomutase [Planctomycetales bacterium]|nr:glutamate-1-semialdehyde 2,1-aminomutase [Planctomycetales bacterium]